MDISPLCRALALHEIFDQRGAVQAGSALPLGVVEDAWATIGLRRSDLTDALNDIRAHGEFALEDCGVATFIVLTAVGFERAQRDLSSLAEIEELQMAYEVLACARNRERYGPAFGRRQNDGRAN
jgi:hypothetical protein